MRTQLYRIRRYDCHSRFLRSQFIEYSVLQQERDLLQSNLPQRNKIPEQYEKKKKHTRMQKREESAQRAVNVERAVN